MIFNFYEYPIRARALRPARDTCEKCHQPETFAGDSLRVQTRFGDDVNNTQSSIYLLLKPAAALNVKGSDVASTGILSTRWNTTLSMN